MGAEDVIKVLDNLGISRFNLLLEIVAKLQVFAKKHDIDLDLAADKLLYKYEDKIPFWADEVLTLIGGMNGGLLDKIDILITLANIKYDFKKLYNEWLEENVEEPEPEPEPKPEPEPLPRIERLTEIGQPYKLISGGDNGIIATDGKVTYMVVGDVFVGDKKYETAIYILRSYSDPRVAKNWTFFKGTTGKCYGATMLNNQLILLQSDKGSGWEGTQNVRVWNVFSGYRSPYTLQDEVYKQGVNWFIVNDPHYNGYYKLGCMQDSPKHRSNEIKSPVRIYKVQKDFEFVGIAKELVGRRNNYMVTCSITELSPNQLIAVTGDWSVSRVDIWLADNILGPWKFIKEIYFSPPMKRAKSAGQYSGAFAGNIFYLNGKRWLIISGHRADLAPEDDSVWITEIKFEY